MKTNPELLDDENPEWTAEDFKRAVPFSDLSLSLQSKLAAVKKPSAHFEPTLINFEYGILDAFRKTGADWEGQINHILKQWLQEHSLA